MSLSIFIPITIVGFPSLFKPILPLCALHTPFVSNRIAGFTIVPRLIKRIGRIGVPIFAMSFSCIYSLQPIPPKPIDLRSYKLKMFWVATRSIPTKMIKLSGFAPWYWLFKKGIDNSMDSFFSTPIKSLPISTIILSALPIPTISNWVDRYITKYSFMLFGRKFDYEHFHSRIILKP